ncbi:hypothetical protein D3C87_1948940 [compost metagenome]
MQDEVTAIAGGGDIEEGELVSALRVVARGNFDRVACVAQLDEIDALDHTASGDVKTGNDSFCEHVSERFVD